MRIYSGILFVFLASCGASDDLLEKELEEALHNARPGQARALLKKLARRSSEKDVANRHLHLCAQYARIDSVALLLAHGADINKTNQDGSTPLHLAAKRDSQTVAFLLRHGANPELPDKSGATALDLAVMGSQYGAVVHLLDHKVTIKARIPGGSALHLALNNSDCKILTELLKHSSEINVRNELGNTPLEQAAIDQNRTAANLLISKGAKVSLPVAVSLGMHDLAQRQIGSNPDSIRWRHPSTQETLLSLACRANDERMMEILLLRGADPKLADRSNCYPIHVAAASGFLPGVRKLRAYGFLNMKDYRGETPLHLAVSQGHKPVVVYLLDESCDANSVNIWGDTVLLSACKNNRTSIAVELLRHGANPNCAEARTLNTPLHYAVNLGDASLVRALLQAGAQVRANSDARTPSHLTMSAEMLRLLEGH